MNITDQPTPIPNETSPVWPIVIQEFQETTRNHPSRELVTQVCRDMADRDTLGFQRYGVRLQAFNGRKHLVDAYQELLDSLVYFRASLEEEPSAIVEAVYEQTLHNVLALRKLIQERE